MGVKKTAKKAGRRQTKASAGADSKPVDLKYLREEIARLVASKLAKMTDAMTEEAVKGHLAQFRYLLELIGVYPAAAGSAAETKDSDDLAEVLLKSFDFPKRAPAGQEAAEAETSAEVASDSVK
jgi:Mn-dependent DtxR family transcriptional regulator